LDKYNVLLIISDEHRRDASGCYGNKTVKTLSIDALAQDGVIFTRAYCPSPLCAPSRASMLTGKYPNSHGALHHYINGKDPGLHNEPGIRGQRTIAHMFRAHGYVTGAIGKMHVHGETREHDLGFDYRKLRFYTYLYEDYKNEVGEEKAKAYLGKGYRDRHYSYNTDNTPTELGEEFMFDNLVAKYAVDFIKKNKDRPFFLHVGFEKPHAPWKTQKKYHDLYNPEDIELPKTWDQLKKGADFDHIMPDTKKNKDFTETQIRNSIAAYYANVTSMDENVGKLITAIKETGLYEKTIIIYTSDHGESLYEHGLIEKHCFFEGAVGIPLIIYCPGLKVKEKTCSCLASLVDIMPTLSEMSGFGKIEGIDGISLLDAMVTGVYPERHIYSEFYTHKPQRMILTDKWKYVYTIGASEQLYDLANDKEEMNNLAYDSEYDHIRAELREKVFEGWSALKDVHDMKQI